MVKRYVMIRMPQQTYDKYINVKQKMEHDLKIVTGRPVQLSMPVFFNGLIDLNENFIQIDIPKLNELVRKNRRNNRVF